MRKIQKKQLHSSLHFLNRHWGLLTAGLLCLLFALSGSLVSLHRFWQYEVFYYDFGIFDMALRNASRFQAPLIEHFVVGGKWIFSDHFNPSIFLLTPLYWLGGKSEALLIVQAVTVGLSGFVLFLIGQKILKQSFYAITIIICYFLFVGLQNAIIADFHEVTIATLFVMLVYYFFLTKRDVLYVVCFLILLGFKESMFLVGVGIGISLFFLNRTRWKLALITCLVSIGWGLLAIKLIIPFFAGKNYTYQLFGTTNPASIGSAFVDKPEKVRTLFYSFFSFGFLPILSPAFWALLLQDFASRFIPPFLTLSWTMGLHYSALTGAIMGISSVFGLQFLIEKIKRQKILIAICVLLLINSIFLYRFILRGPFALSYNPAFYSHTKDFKFLDTLIGQVPSNSSVMTHNNLAVRFTGQNLMLLRSKCEGCTKEEYEIKKPEYIVIDARPGQNPNNFYGITNQAHLELIVLKLKKDKNYSVDYTLGDQYVFKKN